MKQKDWALIAIVVFISGVFSFVLSNFLFGGTKNRQESVEVVQVITPELTPVNEKYFNDKSNNPTQLIKIGNNNNKNPFKSSN